MDYHKIAKFSEAKAYFKTIWRAMESECVLKNLKKILNFLQSSSDEVCFVNMDEKYIPFYYMIVLDNEFLQTTFVTDECKVIANEILHTLEANKNSFKWEVTFNKQIVGIPVIFKKVYKKSTHTYPVKTYEKPIRLEFKDSWIKTTLKFIKSSRLILKYPEMPRREAEYLYKGILKLSDGETDPDFLWAPVWEALNIFKLRYEYMVSLHPTAFANLKFVHFEKIILRQKIFPTDDNKEVVPLEFNEPKLLTDGNIHGDKIITSNDSGIHNDIFLPVISHDEFIKTLLEMRVTKIETIVYTLKVDERKIAPESIVNKLLESDNQSSDTDHTDVPSLHQNEEVKTETVQDVDRNIEQDTNSALSEGHIEDLSLTVAVQDEVKLENIQNITSSAISANKTEGEFAKKSIVVNDNTVTVQNDTILKKEVDLSNLLRNVDNTGIVDGSNNSVKQEMKLPRKMENKNIGKDLNIESDKGESSNVTNTVSLDDLTSEVDGVSTSCTQNSDFELDIESENLSTDGADSVNHNPFIQQITKLKLSNCPLFQKEKYFLVADNMNDSTDITNKDRILQDKMTLINSETNYLNDNSRKVLITSKNQNQPLRAELKPLQESKEQAFNENKVRRKKTLVDNVTTKFVQTSFKAILDFINDGMRASMEMVSLNLQEVNFLIKLHAFSPSAAPIDEIFDKTCVDIARALFNRLKENNDYFLEVALSGPVKKKKKLRDDGTRKRALMFIKRPFKKSKKSIQQISSAQSKESLEDERLEGLKNPKSVERCLVSSAKAGMSPGRFGSCPGYKTSRTPSVSPARHKPSPARSKASKTNSLHSDEDLNDESPRPPVAKAKGNTTVNMKAKLLEGLAVPLESDKAMRMMRLMGWNGGSLGVRGDGLMEPIQPQLDVPKGVGLGHKMFKCSKSNIKKLQIKIMKEKTLVSQTAEALAVNDSRVNISETVNEKHDSIIKNNNENNVDVLNEAIYLNNFTVEKLPRHYVNNNCINENLNIDPKLKTIDSNNDVEASVNTETGTDSKEKVAIGWLRNESLLEKIKNRSRTAGDERETFKKGTEVEVDLNKNSSWTKDPLEDKNRETVRFNHELMRRLLKPSDGRGEGRVESDDQLHPYTREMRSKYLAHRTQFLVHLLELLQSEERVTAVSFTKKPSSVCLGFIDSIIWALNRRVDTDPTVPREERIIRACAKEMEAHGHLWLLYTFKKKVLTLMKSDGTPTVQSEADTNAVESNFETTHSLNDYRLSSQIPQGTKGIARSKILTNRAVLEFVKSGDEARVYDYGRSCVDIRLYIISLISLLNRQMAQYQLGLGSSEHPVFRETLNGMKDFCLIFRFDTQESYFNKLQLVKVDLTKRCRNCRLADQVMLSSYPFANSFEGCGDRAEDIDDVELYPNWADSDDNAIDYSDNDVIYHENTNSSNVYNEASEGDCTDEPEAEQYLVGEDWLDSDGDEASAKNEFDNTPVLKADQNYDNDVNDVCEKEVSSIESNDIEGMSRNCTDDVTMEFRNWPKRLKINENNNYRLTNESIKGNAADIHEDNNQDTFKRKIISTEQKPVEEIIRDALKLNTPGKVLAVDLDSSRKTVETKDNHIDINTRETHANIVEEEAAINILPTDVSKETNEDTISIKSTEVIEENAFKVIESKTLNAKAIDVTDWPKNILILHCNFPKQIDGNSAVALQTTIYEAVNKNRFLPRLKCCGLKNGGMVYTCYDYRSYSWLLELLQGYALVDYEDLNTTNIIEMKINTFIGIDVNVIFNTIEKFYDNIKTSAWTVIKNTHLVDYCVITVEIDDESLESIRKEGCSLFVGIDKAEISIINDKVKLGFRNKSNPKSNKCDQQSLGLLC